MFSALPYLYALHIAFVIACSNTINALNCVPLPITLHVSVPLNAIITLSTTNSPLVTSSVPPYTVSELSPSLNSMVYVVPSSADVVGLTYTFAAVHPLIGLIFSGLGSPLPSCAGSMSIFSDGINKAVPSVTVATAPVGKSAS